MNFSTQSDTIHVDRKTTIEIKRMSDGAKRKMPKTPADHPKYEEMIKTAIRTLKERNGSSRQAIEKYIKANFKVGDTAAQHIKTALKKGAANGTFIHTKGVGASGSFKLPKEQKKPSKKPAAPTSKTTVVKAKKPATTNKTGAKKPAAKKQTSPKKKSPAKSPSSKKDTSKKPAVKKPSATKKTAAKSKLATKKPGTKKEVKKPAAAKKTTANKKKWKGSASNKQNGSFRSHQIKKSNDQL